MKKAILFSLLAMVVTAFSSRAASDDDKVVRGDLTYYLGFGNYTAEIVDCDETVTEILIPMEINVKGRIYTVNRIGSEAFSECAELTSVNIPRAVKVVGANAFYRCYKLEEVYIPDQITELVVGTFSHCQSLKTIHLPEKLELISDYVFQDCTSLEELNLPAGVSAITMQAFRGCKGLKKITLPAALGYIGEWVFYECNSLELIDIKAVTPPETDPGAFREIDYSKVEVIVPDGSLEAYKAHPVWKKFFNMREESSVAVNNPIAEGKTVKAIYNIDGQLIPGTDCTELPKGIYLLEYSDGSTSKLLR